MTERTFTLKDALIFLVIILLATFTVKLVEVDAYNRGALSHATACKLGVINCSPVKKELRT